MLAFLENLGVEALTLSEYELGFKKEWQQKKAMHSLGQGSFARVIMVRDCRPQAGAGRWCAAKIPKPGIVQDFDREALVTAYLCAESQYIVGLQAFVAEEADGGLSPVGRECRIMMFEWCRESLRKCYDAHQGLIAWDMAKVILRGIADGLAHVHDCSILHGDLTPSNVLLSYGGNGVTPKIADFGCCRLLAASPGQLMPRRPSQAPRLADVWGQEIPPHLQSKDGDECTWIYRAPEISLGLPYAFPADMWSFGVIARELITGRQLFSLLEPEQQAPTPFQYAVLFCGPINNSTWPGVEAAPLWEFCTKSRKFKQDDWTQSRFRTVPTDAMAVVRRILCAQPDVRLVARVLVAELCFAPSSISRGQFQITAPSTSAGRNDFCRSLAAAEASHGGESKDFCRSLAAAEASRGGEGGKVADSQVGGGTHAPTPLMLPEPGRPATGALKTESGLAIVGAESAEKRTPGQVPTAAAEARASEEGFPAAAEFSRGAGGGAARTAAAMPATISIKKEGNAHAPQGIPGMHCACTGSCLNWRGGCRGKPGSQHLGRLVPVPCANPAVHESRYCASCVCTYCSTRPRCKTAACFNCHWRLTPPEHQFVRALAPFLVKRTPLDLECFSRLGARMTIWMSPSVAWLMAMFWCPVAMETFSQHVGVKKGQNRRPQQLANAVVATMRELAALATADPDKHARMLEGWKHLAEEGLETSFGVVSLGIRMGVLMFTTKTPPCGVWEGLEAGAGPSRAGGSRKLEIIRLGEHTFTLHSDTTRFEELVNGLSHQWQMPSNESVEKLVEVCARVSAELGALPTWTAGPAHGPRPVSATPQSQVCECMFAMWMSMTPALWSSAYGSQKKTKVPSERWVAAFPAMGAFMKGLPKLFLKEDTFLHRLEPALHPVLQFRFHRACSHVTMRADLKGTAVEVIAAAGLARSKGNPSWVDLFAAQLVICTRVDWAPPAVPFVFRAVLEEQRKVAHRSGRGAKREVAESPRRANGAASAEGEQDLFGSGEEEGEPKGSVGDAAGTGKTKAGRQRRKGHRDDEKSKVDEAAKPKAVKAKGKATAKAVRAKAKAEVMKRPANLQEEGEAPPQRKRRWAGKWLSGNARSLPAPKSLRESLRESAPRLPAAAATAAAATTASVASAGAEARGESDAGELIASSTDAEDL